MSIYKTALRNFLVGLLVLGAITIANGWQRHLLDPKMFEMLLLLLLVALAASYLHSGPQETTMPKSSVLKQMRRPFTLWLLVAAPLAIGYILFAGNLPRNFFQFGLLVILTAIGVIHLGARAGEVGKNFTTGTMVVFLMGMYGFLGLRDPETDPRMDFSILLVAVIVLNLALMVFLRIRSRNTAVSESKQTGG